MILNTWNLHNRNNHALQKYDHSLIPNMSFCKMWFDSLTPYRNLRQFWHLPIFHKILNGYPWRTFCKNCIQEKVKYLATRKSSCATARGCPWRVRGESGEVGRRGGEVPCPGPLWGRVKRVLVLSGWRMMGYPCPGPGQKGHPVPGWGTPPPPHHPRKGPGTRDQGYPSPPGKDQGPKSIDQWPGVRPPSASVDRQTPVKTIPSPFLGMWAVEILW